METKTKKRGQNTTHTGGQRSKLSRSASQHALLSLRQLLRQCCFRLCAFLVLFITSGCCRSLGSLFFLCWLIDLHFFRFACCCCWNSRRRWRLRRRRRFFLHWRWRRRRWRWRPDRPRSGDINRPKTEKHIAAAPTDDTCQPSVVGHAFWAVERRLSLVEAEGPQRNEAAASSSESGPDESMILPFEMRRFSGHQITSKGKVRK